MDEDDRESNASSENDHDEVMDEAEDADNDNEPEAEEDENEDEEDGDGDDDDAAASKDSGGDAKGKQVDTSANAGGANGSAGGGADSRGAAPDSAAEAGAEGAARPSTAHSASPAPRWRPRVDARLINARLYDIVPTMAAPQATSINAFAATPDMRFWITGGSDGYVRKYDGVGTINGKQLLTVAQRHPFVDSVVKGGILMSYWENEEAAGFGSGGGASAATGGAGASHHGRSQEDHVLSPVYSLAVHSQALWLLSGTEGGAINLSSVRHDEGKRIACLTKHSNAVSVLQLLPDEKSVLSGSWDKSVLDWDLNNGDVRRRFDGSGSQISAVELRPASGAPFPHDAGEDPVKSETIWGSTGATTNGFSSHGGGSFGGVNGATTNGFGGAAVGEGGGLGGPDDALGDSGFGPSSPAHESLFGSPAGSLFGDDTMGANGNVFGDDDHGMDLDLHGGGDVTMGDGTDAAPAAPTTPTRGQVDGDSSAPAPAAGGAGAPAQANTTVTSSQSDQQPPPDAVPQDAAQTQTQNQSPQLSSQQLQSEPQEKTQAEQSQSAQQPSSPTLVLNSAATSHVDPTQASDSVFMAAAIDGTIRIWDRRVPNPVARIDTRPGVPPWCMGACWSPDGNRIYAGRRNGTVEEFDIHKARGGWVPERTLKLPAGSGAVSCVRSMVNGRHLVVASHDILRLYDLRDSSAFKGSSVPFLIIPGPPRAGVISHLYIDPSSRFMVSTAGTRGWDGSSTEALVGYEINPTGVA